MATKRKKTNGKKRGGASYRCPACHGVSHVIITRREPQGSVTRIRECLKCHTRFETMEESKKWYEQKEKQYEQMKKKKKRSTRPSKAKELSL